MKTSYEEMSKDELEIECFVKDMRIEKEKRFHDELSNELKVVYSIIYNASNTDDVKSIKDELAKALTDGRIER